MSSYTGRINRKLQRKQKVIKYQQASAKAQESCAKNATYVSVFSGELRNAGIAVTNS